MKFYPTCTDQENSHTNWPLYWSKKEGSSGKNDTSKCPLPPAELMLNIECKFKVPFLPLVPKQTCLWSFNANCSPLELATTYTSVEECRNILTFTTANIVLVRKALSASWILIRLLLPHQILCRPQSDCQWNRGHHDWLEPWVPGSHNQRRLACTHNLKLNKASKWKVGMWTLRMKPVRKVVSLIRTPN